MSDHNRLAERDARDTLTDRLGFGTSAPIQNLPLPQETLAVAFNAKANIQLDYSQSSVRYRLTTETCSAVRGRSIPGTGGPLVLKTGKITENSTYIVCVHKGNATPVALIDTVRVRVGLDIKLATRILIEQSPGMRILDPTLDRPFPDDAARLAPFNSEIQVEVDNAQEDIDYTLETEPATDTQPGTEVSQAPVKGRGPGKSIVLRSIALKEDLVLRIRAKRGLDHSENRLLETRLPLKLMADPGLAISLSEGPIAEFGASHNLRIAASQRSARYRVFTRPIADLDYRPKDLPSEQVGTVNVPGEPQVRVALPELFLEWQPPQDLVPLTDAVAGTGAVLAITLPSTITDQLLLVQAFKTHELPNAAPVPSSVRLAVTAILLVRPNPAPTLDLVLNLYTGGVTVHGGEPGVFYYLRAQAEPGNEFRHPAYIHQRDPGDPALNKGIGDATSSGLTIGVDLAIARDADSLYGIPGAANRISDPPPPPRVSTRGLSEGGELYLHAKKAQTGITAQLTAHARIPATAHITADATEVDAGQSVRFVVSASDTKDRYELRRNAQKERQARNGNGGDLIFNTDPIETDTLFIMRVTRRQPEGLTLVREVPLPIGVRRSAFGLTPDHRI